MKKNELIKRVARATRTSKAACEEILDTFIDEIRNCLINGDKVILRGFMSFEVIERGARKSKDVNTGQPITYPAVKSVKCKVSKSLQHAVKGKKKGEKE